MLVALAAGDATAEDKKDTAKVSDQSADSTVKTKRGLHSFGGEYGGYGGGYGGGWYPSHHIGEYSAWWRRNVAESKLPGRLARETHLLSASTFCRNNNWIGITPQ